VLFAPGDAIKGGRHAMHNGADAFAGIDLHCLDLAVLILHRDIYQQVALDGVPLPDPQLLKGAVVLEPFPCKDESLPARRMPCIS